MKIITFEEKYRDDLIFMILEAKDALGRVPGLNEDLLDIQKSYMDKGGMFWIAIDENDRVIEPICKKNTCLSFGMSAGSGCSRGTQKGNFL